MHSYDLTKKADADLKAIAIYTIQKWGVPQAKRYLELLRAGCESLAKGEGRIKHLENINPDLYLLRCEHHYLLCLHRVKNDQG